jgi:hypothetical protein
VEVGRPEFDEVEELLESVRDMPPGRGKVRCAGVVEGTAAADDEDEDEDEDEEDEEDEDEDEDEDEEKDEDEIGCDSAAADATSARPPSAEFVLDPPLEDLPPTPPPVPSPLAVDDWSTQEFWPVKLLSWPSIPGSKDPQELMPPGRIDGFASGGGGSQPPISSCCWSIALPLPPPPPPPPPPDLLLVSRSGRPSPLAPSVDRLRFFPPPLPLSDCPSMAGRSSSTTTCSARSTLLRYCQSTGSMTPFGLPMVVYRTRP